MSEIAASDADDQELYTYAELLARIFDCAKPERRPLALRAPIVSREGKRARWANFAESCGALQRTEKHVAAYMLAELCAEGSQDLEHALLIRGRFSQAQLEQLLRRYAVEYVLCANCRSSRTALYKEARTVRLACLDCHSQRSVAPIKRAV